MVWAISMVQNPRKSLLFKIVATATKRSIIETPVTISGFTIGMFVIDFMAFFIYFFLIW